MMTLSTALLADPGRIQKPDRAGSPGRSTFGGAARLEKMRAVTVIKPLRPGTGRGRALERERAWEGESPSVAELPATS